MAKQSLAQPPLRSLIDEIIQASGYTLDQTAIATRAGVARETISRWLTREKKNKPAPQELLYKIKVAHKKFLKPVMAKVEEEKVLSEQAKEIIRLRAEVAYLMSIVFSSLPAKDRMEAEAIIEQDRLAQLEKWKAEGTF